MRSSWSRSYIYILCKCASQPPKKGQRMRIRLNKKMRASQKKLFVTRVALTKIEKTYSLSPKLRAHYSFLGQNQCTKSFLSNSKCTFLVSKRLLVRNRGGKFHHVIKKLSIPQELWQIQNGSKYLEKVWGWQRCRHGPRLGQVQILSRAVSDASKRQLFWITPICIAHYYHFRIKFHSSFWLDLFSKNS